LRGGMIALSISMVLVLQASTLDADLIDGSAREGLPLYVWALTDKEKSR
jgi:hypothetical protein